MARRKRQSEYAGGSLCEAHAASHGLSPDEVTIVPHHSEQAPDEEVACDCCTVVIMHRAGVL